MLYYLAIILGHFSHFYIQSINVKKINENDSLLKVLNEVKLNHQKRFIILLNIKSGRKICWSIIIIDV